MAQSNSPSPLKDSYSQAVKQPRQQVFPTREQAIIVDAIEGFSIQEYISQLSKVTDPQNIRFISRISGRRVCAYLNTKENADTLTENNAKITIGEHMLDIKPLMSKSKRIIISNVCPIIPHSVIIEELQKHDIIPISQMLFLRVGSANAGTAHILSFRRQIYIQPDDVSKLPSSLKISYDGTDFWIYLSTDKLTCYLCKEEGHLQKDCKNVSNDTSTLPQDSNVQVSGNARMPVNAGKQTQQPVGLTPVDLTNANKNNECNTNEMPPTMSRPKRQLPTSTTSSASSAITDNFQRKEIPEQKKAKHAKKIKKLSKAEMTREDIVLQVHPAKNIFDDKTKKYPIDYEKTVEFLTTTFGSCDIHQKALGFTDDIAALISLLTDIQHSVTDAKLQRRIDRIKKRLSSDSTISDSRSETDSEKD